jgi:hypothetical protein
MGHRPAAKPVLRSSNEDPNDITLALLQTYGGASSDDDEHNDDRAPAQDDLQDSPPVRTDGSPPRPRLEHRTPTDSTKRKAPEAEASGKKLKLPTEKRKTESLMDGMLKGLEQHSAAATSASDRLLASRQAELEYKKEQDIAELNLRREDLQLKDRAQRHAETIAEARLMRDLGYTKEEIMEFVKSSK